MNIISKENDKLMGRGIIIYHLVYNCWMCVELFLIENENQNSMEQLDISLYI